MFIVTCNDFKIEHFVCLCSNAQGKCLPLSTYKCTEKLQFSALLIINNVTSYYLKY